jgi:putative ABC transport system substrate-binding protein
MKRREFIGLAAGSVMTWPLSAHGQTSTMPMVGFISSLSPLERTLVMPAFHQGLKEAGFVEGRDIAIE